MVAQTAVAGLEGEKPARSILGHLLLESAHGAAQAGALCRMPGDAVMLTAGIPG